MHNICVNFTQFLYNLHKIMGCYFYITNIQCAISAVDSHFINSNIHIRYLFHQYYYQQFSTKFYQAVCKTWYHMAAINGVVKCCHKFNMWSKRSPLMGEKHTDEQAIELLTRHRTLIPSPWRTFTNYTPINRTISHMF